MRRYFSVLRRQSRRRLERLSHFVETGYIVSKTSSRRLQDVPKTPPRRLQGASKTAQRRLQDASKTPPRRLQDASKTAPRRLQDVSKTPPRRLILVTFTILCHFWNLFNFQRINFEFHFVFSSFFQPPSLVTARETPSPHLGPRDYLENHNPSPLKWVPLGLWY